jgi:pimeloyl-ACP methyl ester carboxylesterase
VTDPVRLHVAVDEGDGPPLVMLHGWPQDSRMWRHVVPALSKRFRCIAMDLRGLGRSPAPADGYDKQQLARDVLHTMDDLGLDQVRIVGHDWGGVAATRASSSASCTCRSWPRRSASSSRPRSRGRSFARAVCPRPTPARTPR